MTAEQFAGVGDRGDPCRCRSAGSDELRQPHVEPRATADSGAGDDRQFLVADRDRLGMAMGDAGSQLVVPGLSGPHLGGRQHHRLAQALGELEEQFVHRDRAGQPLAERAQRLVGGDTLAVDEAVGPLGQPAPGGQVEQRREAGGDHRQQQQCALGVRWRAAETEDHDDVDGDDQRRQPGDARRCG